MTGIERRGRKESELGAEGIGNSEREGDNDNRINSGDEAFPVLMPRDVAVVWTPPSRAAISLVDVLLISTRITTPCLTRCAVKRDLSRARPTVSLLPSDPVPPCHRLQVGVWVCHGLQSCDGGPASCPGTQHSTARLRSANSNVSVPDNSRVGSNTVGLHCGELSQMKDPRGETLAVSGDVNYYKMKLKPRVFCGHFDRGSFSHQVDCGCANQLVPVGFCSIILCSTRPVGGVGTKLRSYLPTNCPTACQSVRFS
ncbi:hypothetical protein RRG08_058622 [Elysia crispata]|uniref:Uncharacterized protein n=1 Tax=Elysia crispata TaxID=231223 RepID=A0AAE0Z0E6_9GAST|nr:hypothetical protein RRG08_058622 [Elysia crispata]